MQDRAHELLERCRTARSVNTTFGPGESGELEQDAFVERSACSTERLEEHGEQRDADAAGDQGAGGGDVPPGREKA